MSPNKLREWQSHKVVRAGKILSADRSTGRLWVETSGDAVEIYPEADWWQARPAHIHVLGGYFVQYVDGYTSWSPAHAFEEGYGPVEEDEETFVSLGDVAKQVVAKLAPLTEAETLQRMENLPAPRVTRALIESKIAEVQYLDLVLGSTTTFCRIVMDTGFDFWGKSACASPENYDQGIGRKYAYDDAFRQIWAPEGYLLKMQLYNARMYLQERQEQRQAAE